MDYQQLIKTLTPEMYQSLKRSVELGKWPDGKVLTLEQREHTLQAIIAWDQMHLSEPDRVGFIEKKKKDGNSAAAPLETPLNWKE
jgi:uncharacterized protein YeaC (DUF1315 family)